MCTSAECICVSVSESKIDQFTAIKTRHPIRAPPCLIIVPHIDDRCLWYQPGPACSCHNLQIYHQEAANSPVPGHNFYQFQPPADLNCLPDHNWWYTPTNSMGFIGLDCLGPTWISDNFNFNSWCWKKLNSIWAVPIIMLDSLLQWFIFHTSTSSRHSALGLSFDLRPGKL